MPSIEMDYGLMNKLFEAFVEAEQLLAQSSLTVQTVATDASTSAFTGLVGKAFVEQAQAVGTIIGKFKSRLEDIHGEVGKAVQDMRQGDDAGAKDLDVK